MNNLLNNLYLTNNNTNIKTNKLIYVTELLYLFYNSINKNKSKDKRVKHYISILKYFFYFHFYSFLKEKPSFKRYKKTLLKLVSARTPIFFKLFYYFQSERLQSLCDKIENLNDELRIAVLQKLLKLKFIYNMIIKLSFFYKIYLIYYFMNKYLNQSYIKQLVLNTKIFTQQIGSLLPSKLDKYFLLKLCLKCSKEDNIKLFNNKYLFQYYIIKNILLKKKEKIRRKKNKTFNSIMSFKNMSFFDYFNYFLASQTNINPITFFHLYSKKSISSFDIIKNINADVVENKLFKQETLSFNIYKINVEKKDTISDIYYIFNFYRLFNDFYNRKFIKQYHLIVKRFLKPLIFHSFINQFGFFFCEYFLLYKKFKRREPLSSAEFIKYKYLKNQIGNHFDFVAQNHILNYYYGSNKISENNIFVNPSFQNFNKIQNIQISKIFKTYFLFIRKYVLNVENISNINVLALIKCKISNSKLESLSIINFLKQKYSMIDIEKIDDQVVEFKEDTTNENEKINFQIYNHLPSIFNYSLQLKNHNMNISYLLKNDIFTQYTILQNSNLNFSFLLHNSLFNKFKNELIANLEFCNYNNKDENNIFLTKNIKNKYYNKIYIFNKILIITMKKFEIIRKNSFCIFNKNTFSLILDKFFQDIKDTLKFLKNKNALFNKSENIYSYKLGSLFKYKKAFMRKNK